MAALDADIANLIWYRNHLWRKAGQISVMIAAYHEVKDGLPKDESRFHHVEERAAYRQGRMDAEAAQGREKR